MRQGGLAEVQVAAYCRLMDVVVLQLELAQRSLTCMLALSVSVVTWHHVMVAMPKTRLQPDPEPDPCSQIQVSQEGCFC